MSEHDQPPMNGQPPTNSQPPVTGDPAAQSAPVAPMPAPAQPQRYVVPQQPQAYDPTQPQVPTSGPHQYPQQPQGYDTQQQHPGYVAPPQPVVPQYQPPQGYVNPTTPLYAQYTAQPGYQQPTGPWAASPVGQPQKSGLGAGAWVGIGAGVLALIAGIVLVLVFVVFIPGQKSTPVIDATPETTQPPSPPADDDDEDPDPAPGPRGEGQGSLALEDTADFEMGPFWSLGFTSDWQLVVIDVAGENYLSHPASGCEFYSYQGYGGAASGTNTDQRASEITLETALGSGLGIPWNPQDHPTVTFDATVYVPGAGQDLGIGYAEVEVLRYVAEYEAEDESRHTRVFLIRNFQPSDTTLLAMMDCPQGSEDVGEEFLSERLFVNDVF